MPATKLLRLQLLLPAMFALFFAFLVGIGVQLYLRTSSVMAEHVKNRILSVVSIGALELQDSIDDIEVIDGREDLYEDETKRIVEKLKDIRGADIDIQYAYIMRKTDDPSILEFVADSDSLNTVAELDENDNAQIEPDEEPSYPGDEYDISDTPAMQGPAFEGPVTDDEYSVDQWGTWMSGYAPIVNEDGDVVAILGIDVEYGVYRDLSRAIFPTVSLLVLLGFLFALVTYLAAYSLSTARKIADEMSEKYRETNTLLESIVDHLPVALFCKDVRNQYRFILWNNRSEKIFGLSAAKAIGKNDYDFFPKEQADYFRKTDEGVMKGGVVIDIPDETVNTPDGPIQVHTKKVPVKDAQGRPRYLLGMSEDMTEHLKYVQQAKKGKKKG